MSVGAQFPLREKRKAETRAKLIESAQILFSQNGYEETTLEQVAEHAGLHVQTLYRHFANKQDLSVAGDQQLVELFKRYITHPERNLNTFEFWRGWIEGVVEKITSYDDSKGMHDYLTKRWYSPTIASRLSTIGHEYEDLLSESLAKDFKMSNDPSGLPRVVAIALWGMTNYMSRRYAMDSSFDIAGESIKALDEIEKIFGHLVQE